LKRLFLARMAGKSLLIFRESYVAEIPSKIFFYWKGIGCKEGECSKIIRILDFRVVSIMKLG